MLVSVMALIRNPFTGTTFGAQPVAINTTASRTLIFIAKIEQKRDFVVFINIHFQFDKV
jgi:hypothetical protein